MRADGAAGARRAAALLSTAVCAEIAHTTMDEDGAKVDLKIGLRHAQHPKTLITVHCQVKSGNSYCAQSSTRDEVVLQNMDSASRINLTAKPMHRFAEKATDLIIKAC